MEEILEKYSKLKYSETFQIKIAFLLNKAAGTVKTHWFGRKKMPKKYHSEVLRMLELQLEVDAKSDEYENELNSKIWN